MEIQLISGVKIHLQKKLRRVIQGFFKDILRWVTYQPGVVGGWWVQLQVLTFRPQLKSPSYSYFAELLNRNCLSTQKMLKMSKSEGEGRAIKSRGLSILIIHRKTLGRSLTRALVYQVPR